MAEGFHQGKGSSRLEKTSRSTLCGGPKNEEEKWEKPSFLKKGRGISSVESGVAGNSTVVLDCNFESRGRRIQQKRSIEGDGPERGTVQRAFGDQNQSFNF